MDFIPRLLAITSATLALVAFRGAEAQTPPPPTPTQITTLRTLLNTPQDIPETAATPTTTAIAQIPPAARCGQWWGLAAEAGWEPEHMATLDYVMWRESRCDPTQHNTTLNRDKSTDIGLTQINDRSWCLGTRWYPDGYLQTIGVLRTVGCNELFDPYLNLKAAKALYEYSLRANQDGWQPWNVKS
jgi:hypothetical protein